MRTVSFSDSKLQQTLNNQFVNTFTNTHGDPTSGQSIKHSPSESAGPCIRGNGKQNVQSIFMTPEGEIIHVATGYQSAQDLVEEANFALALFNKMKSLNPNEQKQLVVSEHQSRLNNQDKSNSRSPFAEFDNMANKFMNTRNVGNRGSRNNVNTNSRRESSFPGMNMMNGFINGSVDGDQQFSIDHPLLTYQKLENDPTKLVGNGSSFFASSGFGTDVFEK